MGHLAFAELPWLRPGNSQRVTRDSQDHGLEVPVADQRAAGHGQERIARASVQLRGDRAPGGSDVLASSWRE